MIYTITFAPAMDYYMHVEDIDGSTSIHRARSTKRIVGGKGINVSKMLSTLGVSNTAIVFSGGTIGEWIIKQLNQLDHLHVIPFEINGESRINVKIRGCHEYDINASGSMIDTSMLESLFQWFDQNIQPDDVVVFSGALSNGMTMQWLIRYSQCIHDHKGKVVLDIASLTLKDLKEIKADLVKPNEEELQQWFDHRDHDILSMISAVLDSGTKAVLLSLGHQGGIYKDGLNHTYQILHPALSHPVDTTACGDAVLAGFLAARLHHLSLEDSLRQAFACGLASATVIGLADADSIESVQPMISVVEMV